MNREENKMMGDLISRSAAIIACRENYEPILDFTSNGHTIADSFEDILNALPSAEPQTGKWIQDRSGAYCCSNCMEPCATYIMMKPRDRFCKMCGKRMEVEQSIDDKVADLPGEAYYNKDWKREDGGGT